MTKTSKPDCSVGTACGFACIERKDDCLESVSSEAKALATRLIQQISGEKRAAGAVIGKDELAALKANAEFLRTASPEQIRARAEQRGLQELKADGIEFSEELVDVVWLGLPASVRKKVKLKGGVTEVNAFDPATKSFGPPSEARGKNVLRQYIAQNGRDAYTGLPLGGLRAADLEHIKPMEAIGKDADRPENLVLTSAAVNQWKSGKELSAWLDSDVASRTESDIDQALAKQSTKRAKKNAVEETMADLDLSKIDDDYIDKLGSNYHALSGLTGVSMSFRYTRPATGKVGSKKLEPEVGMPLQKAAVKAMQANDSAKQETVKAARDAIAKLGRQRAEGQLSQDEYMRQAQSELAKLN